jgi:TP901 family phage tail tape measure protein
MGDFDLGTARGKIDIDASGAKRGAADAKNAAKGIEDGTKNVGDSAKTAGVALVGFGALAIGAFAVAIKASKDFEKSLSEFKAVTGSTADQMDLIREKALQLGADTAFSAKEAADAMVELGKQGLSVEDILNGAADATTALAAAGGIELASAAQIAAAALNQFKLQAQDLPAVADLLAGAANASATGVEELGHALSFVGPVAQAMGLSIKDTVDALALLSNSGIDATKGGTALRSILSRLVPASKEAAGTMKELGIITADGSNKFFDAQGNIKSMRDIIDILNSSTSKLSAEQKLQALQTIFGTEALAAANVMAGTTAQSFDELAAKIDKTKAADVAAERMNNLDGALEQLSGSLDTVLIKAGSQFQVGLTKVVQVITGIVNALGKLNPEIQKWIGFAIAGVGAAALLVGGILLLVSAIEKFKEVWLILNVVMSNNPIIKVVLIIAALVAAIVIAYKNVQIFHDFVDRLWDSFQPIWEGIKNTVVSAATAIKSWIDGTVIPAFNNFKQTVLDTAAAIRDWLGPKLAGIWDGIKSGAQAVIDWFKGTFIPGVQGIWSALTDGASAAAPGIIAALQGAWAGIQAGATAVKDWFVNTFAPALSDFMTAKVQPAWQGFLDWVNGTFLPALATVGESIKTALQGAGEAINNAVTSGGETDFFTGLGEKIMTAFNTVVTFLQTTVMPLITTFVTGAITQFGLFVGWIQTNLGPPLTALGELFAAIFNRIGPMISEALTQAQTVMTVFIAVAMILWQVFGEAILNTIMAVWGTIKGVIEGALQVITGIIQIATAIISGDWSKAWEGILNVLQGAWRIIAAVVGGAVELVIGIIQGLANGISGLLSGVWNFVVSKTIETWNSFKNAVSDGVNGAVNFVSSLAGKIIGFLSGIDLFSIGRSILTSLLNGLKSAWEAVAGFLGGLADKIRELKGPPAKDAKLLVGNGELIMGSLVKGLKSGWSEVEGLLGSMTNNISPIVGPGGTGDTSNVTNVNFVINGTDSQGIKDVVSDPSLLRKITSAAAAGRL